MLQLHDYDYTLPPELIAQTPADPPESCKFLVFDRITNIIHDHLFSDITQLIDPTTLIVFNNSKVVKARIPLPQIKGEIFYLESIDTYTCNALVRPGKKFKVGSTLSLDEHTHFTVDAITHEGRQLACNRPVTEVLENYGQMPLPPYITYESEKAEPYQPVFAEKEGSVAAPTASLHFTKDLIAELEHQGVQTAYTTLHVGLGTFKQVDVEDIQTYDIHSETIEIDTSLFEHLARAKKNQQPLLAVGTTVTRTLESLPYLRVILAHMYSEQIAIDHSTHLFRSTLTHDISLEQAQTIIQSISCDIGTIRFSSKLFLYPGKPFYLIDQLITNFHLPKSSLLMLVAGFVGYDHMQAIYAHAINNAYRFYSFGDALWIK